MSKKAATPIYQEWDVKISAVRNNDTGRTEYSYEKLKCSRPAVKINEQEAQILNDGVLKGGNTYAKMYFLSDSVDNEVPADDYPEEVVHEAKPAKKARAVK